MLQQVGLAGSEIAGHQHAARCLQQFQKTALGGRLLTAQLPNRRVIGNTVAQGLHGHTDIKTSPSFDCHDGCPFRKA